MNGKTHRKNIACFQDPDGTLARRAGSRPRCTPSTTAPTRGTSSSPGAADGSLYTISEHVAPPLTFSKVVVNLKRMLDGLVLVRPADEALTRRQALVGARGRVRRCGRDLRARRPARPTLRSSPRAAAPPARAAPAERRAVVTDNGVEVLVPPLHHRSSRRRSRGPADRENARTDLEGALASLESAYPVDSGRASASPSPGVFRISGRFVAAQWERIQPLRHPGSGAGAPRREAVPERSRGRRSLEENDVVSTAPQRRPRRDRRGREGPLRRPRCADEDHGPAQASRAAGSRASLPLAAGVPGADLIPAQAELFLGFTSTLGDNLGPSRIANLETLGLAEIPDGLLHARNAHAAVAHPREPRGLVRQHLPRRPRAHDVPARAHVPPGTLTVPAGQRRGLDRRRVRRLPLHGAIGHSRCAPDRLAPRGRRIGPDGTVYAQAPAIPQRADFNTLDNPFAWSADGGGSAEPAAGVHFVVFNPTSDDFNRVRTRWTGSCPTEPCCRSTRAPKGQGFNCVLRTTRRQNFLVPPRAHRSSPVGDPRLGGRLAWRLGSRRAEVAELVDAPDSKSGA